MQPTSSALVRLDDVVPAQRNLKPVEWDVARAHHEIPASRIVAVVEVELAADPDAEAFDDFMGRPDVHEASVFTDRVAHPGLEELGAAVDHGDMVVPAVQL